MTDFLDPPIKIIDRRIAEGNLGGFQFSKPNPYGILDSALTVEDRKGVRAMVFMPDPDSIADERLAKVFRQRLEANVTGRCPACGNSARLNREQRRRGVQPGQLEHEHDCLVGNENLVKLVNSVYGTGDQ